MKDKISSEWHFCGWKYPVDARSWRRKARLLRVDRRTTVTLWTHNLANLEADELEQQKTRLDVDVPLTNLNHVMSVKTKDNKEKTQSPLLSKNDFWKHSTLICVSEMHILILFLSNVMWSNVVILMLYVYCIYILYIYTVQVHIQV